MSQSTLVTYAARLSLSVGWEKRASVMYRLALECKHIHFAAEYFSGVTVGLKENLCGCVLRFLGRVEQIVKVNDAYLDNPA